MDYRHEDTIKGVHIEYVYKEGHRQKVDQTKLYMAYGDLRLKVFKSHREDSLWLEPKVDAFDVKYVKEARYILDTINILEELAKCVKCEPYRLRRHGHCQESINGEDYESWRITYSKVPDEKWDGIGEHYTMSLDYYHGEFEECRSRDQEEMNIVFDSKGEILSLEKSEGYGQTRVKIKKLITKFLEYCRSEGVVE